MATHSPDKPTHNKKQFLSCRIEERMEQQWPGVHALFADDWGA